MDVYGFMSKKLTAYWRQYFLSPTSQKVFKLGHQTYVSTCIKHIQTQRKTTQGAANFRNDSVLILGLMTFFVTLRFAKWLLNFGAAPYKACQTKCIQLRTTNFMSTCARHVLTHRKSTVHCDFDTVKICRGPYFYDTYPTYMYPIQLYIHMYTYIFLMVLFLRILPCFCSLNKISTFWIGADASVIYCFA